MINWRDIRSVERLEVFRKELNAMESVPRGVILKDMSEYLDEFQASARERNDNIRNKASASRADLYKKTRAKRPRVSRST